MTHEESVRIGMKLRQLMNDESIQTCIQILRDQIAQDILNSQPGEGELRERAYYINVGLNALIATINSFEFVAEQDALNGTND